MTAIRNSTIIPWEARAIAKAKTFQMLGHIPTEPQLRILFNPSRILALSGGERSGKSFAGAMMVIGECSLGELYWLVGPDYENCRQEFEYIKDALEKLEAIKEISFPKEGPCRIVTIWGSEIQTKSAKDPGKLGARAPNGILMCEVALHPYESYTKLVARAAEKQGWVLLTGTLEQSVRWYAKKVQEWRNPHNAEGVFLVIMPTWSNSIIFPGGEANAEILRQRAVLGEDLFMERFGGRPVPPKGLVFPEIARVDHKYFKEEVVWVSGLPIWLGVDPGFDDPYAVVAVQEIDGKIRGFDEIYVRHHLTREVQKLLMEKPWWNPELVDFAAIDISSKAQKDAERTVLMEWSQSWAEGDLKWPGIKMMSNYVPIQAGIDRFKSLLGRLEFSTECGNLYNEFFNYKRYSSASESARWDMKPVDSFNHAIKGLIYLLVAKYGFLTPENRNDTWQDFSIGVGR